MVAVFAAWIPCCVTEICLAPVVVVHALAVAVPLLVTARTLVGATVVPLVVPVLASVRCTSDARGATVAEYGFLATRYRPPPLEVTSMLE